MTTLAQLQLSITDYLNKDPWLIQHHVTTLAENRGDIESLVAEAVSRIGLCAVVFTPSFDPTAEDGVVYGTAAVRVVVYEEPAANRHRAGHCTALDAAERIHILLRSYPNLTMGPLRMVDVGDGIAFETIATAHIAHGVTPTTNEK